MVFGYDRIDRMLAGTLAVGNPIAGNGFAGNVKDPFRDRNR